MQTFLGTDSPTIVIVSRSLGQILEPIFCTLFEENTVGLLSTQDHTTLSDSAFNLIGKIKDTNWAVKQTKMIPITE